MQRWVCCAVARSLQLPPKYRASQARGVALQAGHLVRTKRTTSNEGGVAAGYAVLDSPYLVD